MTEQAGWIYDPAPKHYCMTPKDVDLKDHFEDAIWKCGECGLHWEVYWDQQDRKKDMRPISPDKVAARVQEAAA
jgi:hypothetical protein